MELICEGPIADPKNLGLKICCCCWEMKGVDFLMDLLYSKLPFVRSTVCMRCVLNTNGEFRV